MERSRVAQEKRAAEAEANKDLGQKMSAVRVTVAVLTSCFL